MINAESFDKTTVDAVKKKQAPYTSDSEPMATGAQCGASRKVVLHTVLLIHKMVEDRAEAFRESERYQTAGAVVENLFG